MSCPQVSAPPLDLRDGPRKRETRIGSSLVGITTAAPSSFRAPARLEDVLACQERDEHEKKGKREQEAYERHRWPLGRPRNGAPCRRCHSSEVLRVLIMRWRRPSRPGTSSSSLFLVAAAALGFAFCGEAVASLLLREAAKRALQEWR